MDTRQIAEQIVATLDIDATIQEIIQEVNNLTGRYYRKNGNGMMGVTWVQMNGEKKTEYHRKGS